MAIIKQMMMNKDQDVENKMHRNLWQKIVEIMRVINDLEVKCEYLFSKMETGSYTRSDKEAFWKQCGFSIENDAQLIEMIKQHPLLLETGSISGKPYLVRLVDELGIKEILSDDNQLKTHYLLNRLQREYQRIENIKSFWESAGFTITHDSQLILLIKEHPLLMAKTVYKGETVLERLVEELGVKALIYGDKTLQIEYLLHLLQRERKRIGDANLFWQRIGFTVADDPQMISLIKMHPLLNVKTVYKGKTVSERLLEELGMFKELISSDKQTQIEWLLRLLQNERNCIENKNLFWQGIGFAVSGDPQMISLIKNHPLLTAKTEHQGKAVLERLMEELGFKERVHDDHSLQIDWLLCRLRSEKNCIENKNLFWQRIGFTVADDPQMISLIKMHPLLNVKTVYKGKTVSERLLEELGMFKELISSDKQTQIEWLLRLLQ
eukprot:95308_1